VFDQSPALGSNIFDCFDPSSLSSRVADVVQMEELHNLVVEDRHTDVLASGKMAGRTAAGVDRDAVEAAADSRSRQHLDAVR